jgi:hypothetical protein
MSRRIAKPASTFVSPIMSACVRCRLEISVPLCASEASANEKEYERAAGGGESERRRLYLDGQIRARFRLWVMWYAHVVEGRRDEL